MSFLKRSSKMAPEDFWFSLLVKFRDNFQCKICDRYCPQRHLNNPDLWPVEIECMHFFKRGNQSTRFELKLAAAGCVPCHRFYEDQPLLWEKHLIEKLGQSVYDAAKRLSRIPNTNIKYEKKELATKFKSEVMRLAKSSDRVWIIEKYLGKKELHDLLHG